MLGPAGLGERSVDLTRRAVEIALEARDRLGAGDTVAVAGSMSHQVPLHPGTDYRDPAQLPSPGARARPRSKRWRGPSPSPGSTSYCWK